jgi:light-regulated signal transduction histidine kinase (bacteriophytochrome)
MNGFSEEVLLNYGEKLDEQGKDSLNRIRKASQTMSQLIDDILKLSRITRADIHFDKVNISGLVNTIGSEIKIAHPERQVIFVIQPEIEAYGDSNLLNIALTNLIENSWKFTIKNSQARIEFGVTREDGKPVYFVKDNGVGFDMKYADKLFQPFRRLHTDREFPGTGIGLATVQRIIQRHGGRIWAESEPGKGTTLFFNLGGE